MTAAHEIQPVDRRRHLGWMSLNVSLLLLYVAFFHACLGASYTVCMLFGVGCWLVWSIACHIRRAVFVTRVEYIIHQIVGVDILLEGFNPYHQGYGFYGCAMAFWGVLWGYRLWVVSSVSVGVSQPESESGVVLG